MEKSSQHDIAAFPELFEGIEEFLDEQSIRLRRAGTALAAGAAGGMLLAWLAQRVA